MNHFFTSLIISWYFCSSYLIVAYLVKPLFLTSRQSRKLLIRKETKTFYCSDTNSTISASAYFEHASLAARYEKKFNLSFVVYGEPIPLSRHMLSGNRMYNPSAKFQKSFLNACNEFLPSKPFDGPIEILLIFYIGRPKNHYRTGKYSSILKNDAPTWHTSRKDLDNLVKFVLDCLNKKVYIDDAQVVSIHSYKFFTDGHPRVAVKIKEYISSQHLE